MAEAAGEVKVIFAADTASWSQALDKAQQQLNKLKGASVDAGRVTRKELAESKGAAAVLGEELGIRLPRHVRNFVAELPGVSRAMSAAFNAIAVFAIINAIAEATSRLVEFAQKSQEAARKNAEAWRSVQQPLRATADDLRLANDKLENAIAKLEHKPENKLKEAIDEAIVSAGKLGDKLDEDLGKIATTLKGQEPGWFAQFMGVAGTGDITKRAQGMQEFLESLDLEGHNRLEQLRKSGATAEQLAQAQRAIDSKRKAALDAEVGWANRELATATAEQTSAAGGGALNQRRIALLAQYGGGLARESDIVGLSMTHQDLARRSDVLQGQHDAEEAAKAAVQKQIESSQELLAAIRARTTMTAKAEADFWQAIAATDAKGGLLRTEATKRANLKLGEQMQQDAAEKSARIIAGARDNEAMQEHISDALYETMVTNQRKLDEGDQKAQQAAIEAFKKGEQERLDAERVAEDHIRAQMASGGLSRLEGAQAIAALHAQGAAAWQQSNQSFRNAFPDVSTPGAAGTMTRISIQAQADQRALETARTLSALKDSAQHLASEFTDTAAIVSDLLVTSLKSFNDTLVHILTARSGSLQGQHPFKQLGAGIFGDIAKYGLQELEGQLLKLVLGKNPLAKLGTIGNPMHAIIDAFGPGAAGGGAGGAIGSGAGGVIGGVLGAAMSFLPGYADGGPVSTNMPILVGENGPEIFQPTTSGRIVPNHSIGSSGATIHVDARGAGDPAAVEAAVHRSMRAYIPAMAQLARGAVADDRKRTPSRLRGR